MIRIKLASKLDDIAFERGGGARPTLDEMVDATGISRTTLIRIRNIPGYNAELAAIDALCRYLKCQPGDLLEYVPDDRTGPKGKGQKRRS